MNKAEITKAIADKSCLAAKDSERFLKTFTEVVAKTLSNGEEVALIGLGAFSVRASRSQLPDGRGGSGSGFENGALQAREES